MASDNPYLDAFPGGDDAAWRERVLGVLKGRSADTLAARSYDDILIAPLYPSAQAAIPIVRNACAWAVMQRVDIPDAENANAQALEDLGNGADGLQLVFRGGLGDTSLGDTGFALDHDVNIWRDALDDVVLDAEVPIEIDALDTTGTLAIALADEVSRRHADPGATRIAFGLDPFGALARGAGGAPDEPALARVMQDIRSRGLAGPVFVADARVIHAAGGSEAQEIGYALAAALASMRLLESAGMPLAQAQGAVSFRIAVDADEFLGVAKLRALRKLWSSIEQDCGLAPAPAHIHAETAWRSLTRRDPDVNMLRATLAVFAAAIGGADRITVLPHTQALGLPDAFARRVARNTQLVLREEANLDKVADPAAGSGGFEALTEALCEKGWAVFQSIEAAGGLAAALADATFRTSVEKVAEARRRNVARRRDGIIGVSEFAALNEAASPIAARADEGAPKFLVPHRLSEPFEVLRDRSDAHLAATGSRPKVFLATFGPIAAWTPRATFAKNLFEAGGFATVLHQGVDTVAGLAMSLKASGAGLACLCSSDALYAERAAEVAKALAPHARVILAGRPGEAEASLRAAGVADFAYAGADVLALLEGLSA